MLTILINTGRRSATCLCFVCKASYEVLDRFTAAKVHAGDQCSTCKNLPSQPPTQALLHQIYNYDAGTGALTYKRDFHRRHKSALATTPTANGYLVVTLDATYLAHRIIWLMQTGAFPEFVDHEDHVRSNNQWTNLRDVTRQANAQNKSVNTNNTSGYLGVSFMPQKNKFRATITINRKQVHLGLFATALDAHQARLAANAQHAFHTNHGDC